MDLSRHKEFLLEPAMRFVVEISYKITKEGKLRLKILFKFVKIYFSHIRKPLEINIMRINY